MDTTLSVHFTFAGQVALILYSIGEPWNGMDQVAPVFQEERRPTARVFRIGDEKKVRPARANPCNRALYSVLAVDARSLIEMGHEKHRSIEVLREICQPEESTPGFGILVIVDTNEVRGYWVDHNQSAALEARGGLLDRINVSGQPKR